MTQADLARASGLSQAAVSEIELGKVRQPTIDSVTRLAGALGVEIADLTGVAEPVPLSDAEWAEIRGALERLDHIERRALLAILWRLAAAPAQDTDGVDLRAFDAEEREVILSAPPAQRQLVADTMLRLREIDRERAAPLDQVEQQPRTPVRRSRA
jgi:transcriptional regulator with XRE-family HTH domain